MNASSVADALELSWQPTPEIVGQSNLRRFMDRHRLANAAELQRWSTSDLARFWAAVDEDLDLEWYVRYQQVLDTSQGVPWTRWWQGGRFNYVHNALDKHARGAAANRDGDRLRG